LESRRNRCLVVGEDLGTVPDEIRTALAQRGILSCRLLYFERDEDGDFKAPGEYPRDALVAVGTHDLPTLNGWWQGRDLRVRRELGLIDEDSLQQQLCERAGDRTRLLEALARADRLPPGASVKSAASSALDPALVEAIHAYLADTPSRVMLLQIEDALGIVEQTNLPATVDEHPNWRRKLPVTLERMAGSEAIGRLAFTLSRLRLSPVAHSPDPPRSLQARVSRATYRLQFHRAFTFDDAVRIVPYLARLGISHVYCSPILKARPGSTHGYDIVAHDEINPELGGAAGFGRFGAALREHGMGQLLDMVPNHMGVLGADNAWWMDVLENGPASAHARHFDIEWEPVDPELRGKVLLPVLGAHYGDVLAGEDLHLAFEPQTGSLALRYHEHRFPLDPRTYAPVLTRARALAPDEAAQAALARLAAAFGGLPPREAQGDQALADRARNKELHKASLARLAAGDLAASRAIEAALAELNGNGPRDALHEL
ncbi:MAG: 4-alpha-glucanotransferase, partial [Gammaproteobacteria bacterium]